MKLSWNDTKNFYEKNETILQNWNNSWESATATWCTHSCPTEGDSCPVVSDHQPPECPTHHLRPHSNPTFYKKLQISLLRTDLSLPWPQLWYLIKAPKWALHFHALVLLHQAVQL